MPVEVSHDLNARAQAVAQLLQAGQHGRSWDAIDPQLKLGLRLLHRAGEPSPPSPTGDAHEMSSRDLASL